MVILVLKVTLDRRVIRDQKVTQAHVDHRDHLALKVQRVQSRVRQVQEVQLGRQDQRVQRVQSRVRQVHVDQQDRLDHKAIRVHKVLQVELDQLDH